MKISNWRIQNLSHEIIPLVFTILLAFFLRVRYLTGRSLWFDEAFSWRLIQFPFPEFLNRAAADVHPVLYYIILRLWMVPFGWISDGTTLFGMRFLSVLLSTGTVAAMYFAGKILFRSRFVGASAALLTAVNAFQLQYAWEARMYALGTLLLPVAFVLLIKTLESEGKKMWLFAVLLGLVTGMLFHVHYFMLLSIGALVIFIFLYIGISYAFSVEKTLGRYAAKKNMAICLVAPCLSLVISFLVFLPWFPVFLKQRAQVQESYWIPPMNEWSIPNTMARVLLGGVSDFSHSTAVISSVLVVIFLGVPLVWGRKKSDWLLFVSFVIPFLGSWWLSRGTSIYQDRYFVFASLPLILLVSRSISFLPKKVNFIVLLIAGSIGMSTIFRFWKQLDFQNHPGAAGAAEYLKRQEPVIVSSSFVYFPMKFHLDNIPLLYSESGKLSHFGGGPILTEDDIVGPEIFNVNKPVVYVVDTTGFGGSRLIVPETYELKEEKKFPELFGYQGDIIVRKYERLSVSR